MLPIDKGIPMPNRPGVGGVRKYPFYDMEIGDSFGLTCKEDARRAVACAASNNKRTGFKFSIQKHGTGWRCWRIA